MSMAGLKGGAPLLCNNPVAVPATERELTMARQRTIGGYSNACVRAAVYSLGAGYSLALLALGLFDSGRVPSSSAAKVGLR